MIHKNNENLKKYTTFKMGGIAKNFYIPESEEELINLLNNLKEKKYYILGGGSNLLINDQAIFDHVIFMRKFNREIEINGNDVFAGASVTAQQLITTINKNHLGGIEYLYSLPATLGGMIAMNAGRGEKSGKSISDFICEVKVYKDGKVSYLSCKQCDFSYRNSIFKSEKYVILGASFRFNEIDPVVGKKLVQERREYSRTYQDTGYSFGSLFRVRSKVIMHLLKIFWSKRKESVYFSDKNANWLINSGKGSYQEAIDLIKLAKKIHRLFFKRNVLEVVVWKGLDSD